jgi:hypothetical protein
MGWSIGFDNNWKRDIGYGVPAICDHPKCNKKIDRGLSFVCGEQPYGGEHGCGLFFCSEHLIMTNRGFLCPKCARYDHKPYKPKPDIKEWVDFKMTDQSWAKWREENNIT